MRAFRIATGGLALVAVGVLASASLARPATRDLTIVSVRAFPAAAQRGPSKALLDPAKLNTVAATSALAFRVVVHNGSAARQTNVHVVLVISRPTQMGGPVVQQVTVGSIPADNTRAVTFANLGTIPFASRVSLTVSVPSGGTKVYPVIFSLPSGNFAPPTTPIRIPPKVVGLDQQAAIQKLEAAGFQVLIVLAYSRQPAGRVLGTRTGSGISVTGVPPVQVVEITVSNGKKPG